MSDTLTNSQYVNSLFVGIPAFIQQNGAQQQQLALMALKRRQQLEDQQAQFDQQRSLANETTDRYIKVEDERSRRSEEHDKRAKEEAAKNQAKQAYAEYARIAADTGQELKPFESFGSTADDVSNGIRQEMARIQGAQQDEAFKSVVDGYKSQLSSLRAMSSLNKNDREYATQNTASSFEPLFTDKDVWAKAVGHLLKGDDETGLSLLDPRDKAAFLSGRNTVLQAIQTRKQDASKYASEMIKSQGVELFKTASRSPKWAKAYAAAMAEDTPAVSQSGAPNFDEEYGNKKKAAVPPPKTSGVSPEQSAMSPLFSLKGLAQRATSSPSLNTADIVASPGRAIDAIARLGAAGIGGLWDGNYSVPEKGIIQMAGESIGDAVGGNYDRWNADLSRRAATVNPSSPLSLTQPQSNSLRELILRSLFSAQPTLPPQ